MRYGEWGFLKERSKENEILFIFCYFEGILKEEDYLV